MKYVTFNKLALSVAIAAIAGLGGGAQEVQAQVMDAVCPNGASATFANNRLNCTVPQPQSRGIVCGNSAFPRYVAITEAAAGSERDVCAANTADGQAINSTTNLTLTVATPNACDAGDTAVNHASGRICTNAGISIPANANLANFREGRNAEYYRPGTTNVPRFGANDFERVPTNGLRNSFSYVQGIAAGNVIAQGWALSLTGTGALDRYRRTIQRDVSALLTPNL
jgi:hypothetical protein